MDFKRGKDVKEAIRIGRRANATEVSGYYMLGKVEFDDGQVSGNWGYSTTHKEGTKKILEYLERGLIPGSAFLKELYLERFRKRNNEFEAQKMLNIDRDFDISRRVCLIEFRIQVIGEYDPLIGNVYSEIPRELTGKDLIFEDKLYIIPNKLHINNVEKMGFKRGQEVKESISIGIKETMMDLRIKYKELTHYLNETRNAHGNMELRCISDLWESRPDRLVIFCGWANMHSIFDAMTPEEYSKVHGVIMEWHTYSKYLVFLSVPTEQDLIKYMKKLERADVKYSVFKEPDIENQITSIAIEPCDRARRICSNLPLILK